MWRRPRAGSQSEGQVLQQRVNSLVCATGRCKFCAKGLVLCEGSGSVAKGHSQLEVLNLDLWQPARARALSKFGLVTQTQ